MIQPDFVSLGLRDDDDDEGGDGGDDYDDGPPGKMVRRKIKSVVASIIRFIIITGASRKEQLIPF